MQGVNLVKSDFCLFMNFLKNQGEKKFCRLNWFVADVICNIRCVGEGGQFDHKRFLSIFLEMNLGSANKYWAT